MKPKPLFSPFLLTALCLLFSACSKSSLNVAEQWIAFFPILIYLLIIFLVFVKLGKDGVTLRDLLLDKDILVQTKKEEVKEAEAEAKKLKELNESIKILALNKTEAAETVSLTNSLKVLVSKSLSKSEEGEEQGGQRSISRLLAFVSGLVSVGIASVITTFYIWEYFTRKEEVKMDGLLTTLLTLGIGVVPYAFNKVASALK